jgi:hypothetical protein
VRVLPTAAQKKAIKLAFGVARKAYNYANDRVRSGNERPNAQNLRKEWNNRKAEARLNPNDELRWIIESDVHSHIDAEAIRELAAAYKSNDAKRKKGGLPSGYTVGYRSFQKTRNETLNLEKLSTGGPLLQFRPLPFVARKKHAQCLLMLGKPFASTGGLLLEDTTKVIDCMVAENRPLIDGKLKWDKKLDSFHFIYTYELPVLPDPNPECLHKRIVATDPGVRPFQAWYSPTSGEHGRLLEGETDILNKRSSHELQ